MLIPSVFKESLLDDLFDRDYTVERQLYGNKAKDLMKVDIKENDHDFELFVDLPGFKKENLTLDLTNGYLTITGNKTIDKGENKKYIRKERFYGTVSRSFYVGDEVKKEDIKAKFENGVLKLNIPKVEEKVESNNGNNYIAIEG